MFYYANDNSCSGGSGELLDLEYLALSQKASKPAVFSQSLLTFIAEVRVRNTLLLSVFKNQGCNASWLLLLQWSLTSSEMGWTTTVMYVLHSLCHSCSLYWILEGVLLTLALTHSCLRDRKVFCVKEWGIEVSVRKKNLYFWSLAKRRGGNFIWGHGRIAFRRVVCSGFTWTEGAGLQKTT